MTVSLLLSAGCALHVPPAALSVREDWQWQVDRRALPDGTLRVLHVATVEMKERQVLARGSKEALVGPISVLLLEHPVQGLVLIDTGYGRRTAASPFDYPGRLPVKILGLNVGRPAADALPDLGYDVSDVWHVVITHGHMDHVAGVEDFPAAEIHADEDEWAACQHPHRTRGYLPEPYRHRDAIGVLWENEPYGPFERHADLFGDGSIVLLPAPGHTIGSLMVLVNLSGGSVLYTGDAAWVDENWQDGRPKGWLARKVVERDWRQGMDALWRIQAWTARHPELRVIAGHEPSNLTGLPLWPAALIVGADTALVEAP